MNNTQHIRGAYKCSGSSVSDDSNIIMFIVCILLHSLSANWLLLKLSLEFWLFCFMETKNRSTFESWINHLSVRIQPFASSWKTDTTFFRIECMTHWFGPCHGLRRWETTQLSPILIITYLFIYLTLNFVWHDDCSVYLLTFTTFICSEYVCMKWICCT